MKALPNESAQEYIKRCRDYCEATVAGINRHMAVLENHKSGKMESEKLWIRYSIEILGVKKFIFTDYLIPALTNFQATDVGIKALSEAITVTMKKLDKRDEQTRLTVDAAERGQSSLSSSTVGLDEPYWLNSFSLNDEIQTILTELVAIRASQPLNAGGTVAIATGLAGTAISGAADAKSIAAASHDAPQASAPASVPKPVVDKPAVPGELSISYKQ